MMAVTYGAQPQIRRPESLACGEGRRARDDVAQLRTLGRRHPLPGRSGLHFYFLTRKSTLKYKNAAGNGKAAFNVGLFGGGKRGNFQISGKIAPLREKADWRMLMLNVFSQRQLNDLHMDARKDDPFYGLKGHDFVALILKPKFIRWMRISRGKPTYDVLLP